MPIKRSIVAAVLISMLLAAGSLQAKVTTTAKVQPATESHVVAKIHTSPVKSHAVAKTHTSPVKSHVVAKAHATSHIPHVTARSHTQAGNRSVAKAHTKAHAHRTTKNHVATKAAVKVRPQADAVASVVAAEPATMSSESTSELTFHVGSPAPSSTAAAATGAVDGDEDLAKASTPASAENVTDLRKALIGLAMDLRHTRYVRGGSDPSTGFDCSGFVRYVFAHAIGMKLPTNSASQFLAGLKVDRADMKPGDLVFFQTGRKRHISHVGIYLSNGRFIHSPTTGKTVQVSSLSESYWARHFAGAKRPSGIVAAADNG